VGPTFVLLAVAVLAPPASTAAARAPHSGERAIPIAPPEAWPGGRPSNLEPRRTPRALSFTPTEVVVISERGVLDATHGAAPLSRDGRVMSLFQSLGLERARRIGPTPRVGKSRRGEIWLLTSTRPGFDPVAAARSLQATGAFLAACPNYKFGLLSTIPDDLYLIYQWYVDDGSFADVRLPFAWDLERGDTSTVIAIIDTGVDATHPDLASQIWHNPGEIAGNALDDDGNGLIDDFEGWDFGMGDNEPKPEYTADASGIDVGFHGTFCAGIAAAATNNADGIAGAGWECRIMPLKVSHPDSGITSVAIAGAFVYAVDQGASVISMSFGGPGDPGVPEFFQALADMATTSGVLCVASAGNDGDSVRVYPAACGNVLAVAATDFDNARASFSNWGPWVDVAAPGSLMWSTICQNYTFTELDQLFYILLFGWDGVSPYMYGDGTSFACPLTAGVCGLIRSHYPYLTPQLVAQHVIATGDAVAYDRPIGVKLNAFSAVSAVPTAVTVDERTPTAARVGAAPNPVFGSGSIRFALPAAGWVSLLIYDSGGRRVRKLFEGELPAGPHLAHWDGRNDRGSSLAAAVYFARLESKGTVVTAKVVLMDR
jgi:subtilisin family serine protease